MDYRQNKSACSVGVGSQAKSPYPPAPVDTCVTQCEPRSLEQMVSNVVDYVAEINSTRAQAAALRERLAGSWPESSNPSNGPSDPGLLGVLGQFQGQAWGALWELRDHLSAIQKAIG